MAAVQAPGERLEARRGRGQLEADDRWAPRPRPGRARSARAARTPAPRRRRSASRRSCAPCETASRSPGSRSTPGRGQRLLAVDAAEPDVGVGGADRAVERAHRSRLAADVDRPLHLQPAAVGGRDAADQLERDVRLPVARRGRRARRGRCSRSTRPCPRGPGPWPGRGWRGEARTARTRGGRGAARGAPTSTSISAPTISSTPAAISMPTRSSSANDPSLVGAPARRLVRARRAAARAVARGRCAGAGGRRARSAASGRAAVSGWNASGCSVRSARGTSTDRGAEPAGDQPAMQKAVRADLIRSRRSRGRRRARASTTLSASDREHVAGRERARAACR